MSLDHRRPRAHHSAVLVPVLVSAVAVFAVSPMRAGRAVISANQHPVLETSACGSSPFPSLGDLASVSAQAYHVSGNSDTFDKARCLNHFQRPRFIGDDASFQGLPPNTPQQAYITDLCNDINADIPELAPGVEHYEHWARSLSDRSKRGATIGGYNTWFVGQVELDARGMIRWFGEHVRDQCSTTLKPNGTLFRDLALGGNPRRLLWNDNTIIPPAPANFPATLIGFGHMGALTAGDRTVLVRTSPQQDGYLGTLRAYGANLTRIWAIEQWTGRAVCPSPSLEGLTPFAGSYPNYDLSVTGLNPAFFARLREFAQLSADRGIIVQLSLFDKHGLVNRDCEFAWASSPYNKDANSTPTPSFIDGTQLNTCDCDLCDAPQFGESESPPACNTIPEVLNDSRIVPINNAYLERVAQEVGGVGNMIFEIMNEMYAGEEGDWWPIGESWQMNSVATPFNWQLPVFTARDAFNGVVTGTGLATTRPDSGLGTWTAQNAATTATADPETSLLMGKMRGNNGALVMRGSLELPAGSRTKLGVRGDVSRMGNTMELGFSQGANPSGNSLRVEIGPPMLLTACTYVSIVKRNGGNPTVLDSTCIQVPEPSNIHFVVNLVAGTGTVYLNSAPLTELQNVPLEALPSLTHAYFRGSKASPGNYGPTHGEIDNFEANVYCSDPGNCTL